MLHIQVTVRNCRLITYIYILHTGLHNHVCNNVMYEIIHNDFMH